MGLPWRASPGDPVRMGRVARPPLPDDLPVVERTAVRVVVLDSEDRVLLFHTHDPTYPELETWWELPGGGLEGGESRAEAAVRELREETGLVVTTADVVDPGWRRLASFRYRGRRHLQHETVVTVRVHRRQPVVDGRLRVGFEDEDYFDWAWWTIDQLVGSDEQFYPRSLPSHLPAFLAGEQIDEPFELWS